QLEESELYRLPCFACQRGGELLERLRPLAAARAVRETDDGGAQRLCDGESSAAIQWPCGGRIFRRDSMNRVAPSLVDALQEPERPEADGAMRERVAQVFDDVERHPHVQAGEHARGALGVDARHDGIKLAVHQVDARADARAAVGKARVARREGDYRARDAR